MRILIAGMALLAAGLAWAEPPREVVPEGNISLSVGQIKVFMFDDDISRAGVMTQGQVEVTAQTDRQISIVAIGAGVTQMSVYSSDGKRLYGATVTVTPEPGHIVKIYGTGKNDDINAGYVSVYCNSVSCGRPDRDLPTPSVTVERVSRGSRDSR